MKKQVVSGILLLAMILSSACGKKENSEDPTNHDSSSEVTEVTEKTEKTEPSDTEGTSVTDPGTSSFQFTENNYPVIDGSTSTKPMATAITSVMLGIPRSEADSMLEFHKTTQSFSYLMDGSADMLICAQPADEVFDMMESENFECEMEAFSAEALVFVVNTSNPVESLTTEQIQKIYTGEIKNWKEVGGEDKEIVAIQRNKTAGSQVMMEKTVMGDLQMMQAPEELMPGDMSGLISVVKSYDNSAGAIGYTPYYYAKNMKMADGLKILKIDGVMPDTDTIAKGEYPFRTSYFVVIPKTAPADAPARILFNWILSEEGQKLAEMEGYVPASSDPAGKSNVAVSVNWTSYQPADAADPVFTRIKDEEIPDFVPSSDYGRVFPYCGSVKKGMWDSYASMLGFFDSHGQIVCDPVYDNIYFLTEDMYAVVQYIPNPQFPERPTVKYGVVSADGTKFTGMKFVGVYYRPDGGISLVEKTTDGINVYPFDGKTGDVGTPSSYKESRDVNKHFDDSVYIDKIVNDQYIVYSSDEGDRCRLIYDGKTGRSLEFQNDLNLTDCVGNLLVGYDSQAFDGKMHLCDFSGERLEFDVDYSDFREVGPDRILMIRANNAGWDLADADGKILASIENKGQAVKEFFSEGDYFVARKKKSFEIYDKDFKPVRTTEIDDTEGFYQIFDYDYSSVRWNTVDTDKGLYFYRAGDRCVTIMNILTGAATEIQGEYSTDLFPGYILLSNRYSSTQEYNWKLLDTSDLTVLLEGKGYAGVCNDLKDNSYYITIRKDWDSDTLSLVDVKTGETVLSEVPNPRGDNINLTCLYDGNLLYNTWHGGFEPYTSSTTLVDRDGKVVFLYNTLCIPED